MIHGKQTANDALGETSLGLMRKFLSSRWKDFELRQYMYINQQSALRK